jgi:hypothetical protein
VKAPLRDRDVSPQAKRKYSRQEGGQVDHAQAVGSETGSAVFNQILDVCSE